MADEKVTIKIEVRSDDGAIDKTRRKLERLSGAEGRHYKKNSALASKGTSDIKNYGKNTDNVLNNGSRKWKKHFDQLDKSMQKMGGGLLKLVAMSAKMAAVEIAGMGLALVGVHGAFLIGKGLSKAYQVAMQGVAAGVAALAIAAGTAAAAMREQQASMYAFSQKGMKEFGSGLNQTRVAMRMLTHDSDMAAVGVDNLNAAYGEIVNKSGKFNAGSAKMLKGLMDFASAGQDMKTGTKAAATLVAELQNVKGTYASIKTAAKGLGPQMTKALEAYEKAGGGYKGGRSKSQAGLKKWGKEKWTTSDGKPSLRKGKDKRYLPERVWKKLKPAEKSAANRAKAEGSKRGDQFVPNTPAVKKVFSYNGNMIELREK